MVKILLLCVFVSGCQLGLSTYYAKGYLQTESEKDILGEVKISQTLYKSRQGGARVVGSVSHESALFDQSDNKKGLNKVGVSLIVGVE